MDRVFFLIGISVAMMCEDPEEHKLIRQVDLMTETDKIDNTNKKFVSISLSLGAA